MGIGERKKCQSCDHRITCVKLSEYRSKYGKQLNPLSKNLIEAKVCKQMKANPYIMKKMINLAMISTYGATGNYSAMNK